MLISTDERRFEFDGHCREGVLSHLQVWKRNYYAHTTIAPQFDAHAVLITDSGLIPFRLPHRFSNYSYEHLLQSNAFLNGGRVSYKSSSEGVTHSSNRLVSAYCVKYSSDFSKCLHPLPFNQIKILTHSSKDNLSQSRKSVRNSIEVTLLSICWLSDAMGKHLRRTIMDWSGPKILVLGGYGESLPSNVRNWTTMDQLTMVYVDLTCKKRVDFDYSLLKSKKNYSELSHNDEIDKDVNSCDESGLLPDKMMYNIALDLLYTELVFILPPNYHLHYIDKIRRGEKSKGANINNMLYTTIRKSILTTSKSPMHNHAVIVPAYSHIDPMAYHLGAQAANNSLEDMISFPSKDDQYTSQQATPLSLDFKDMKATTRTTLIEEFRGDISPYDLAQLLKSKTILLPIAFNVSNSHGTGSIR